MLKLILYYRYVWLHYPYVQFLHMCHFHLILYHYKTNFFSFPISLSFIFYPSRVFWDYIFTTSSHIFICHILCYYYIQQTNVCQVFFVFLLKCFPQKSCRTFATTDLFNIFILFIYFKLWYYNSHIIFCYAISIINRFLNYNIC